MKTRQGFVSNSSSSSFICDVCGATESGMDMCHTDFDMSQCPNGHLICNSHALDIEEKTIQELKDKAICIIKEEFDKDSKYYDEYMKEVEELYDNDDISGLYEYLREFEECEISEDECPICMFKNIEIMKAKKILLKHFGILEEEVLSELKERFSNYMELKKWLNQ